VGSFGERLRREREMRGIGLEEIATATKISTRNLRALEDEKFDQLPGGIFNKGFVRAYARFLGIDEEHIVAEYEAASRETETVREQKLQEEFAKAEFRKPKTNDSEISLEPKSEWGTIAAIVLVAALAYGGYNFYQRRRLDKLQQPQTVAPVAKQTPTPALPTPPPATDPSAPTSTGQSPANSIPQAAESPVAPPPSAQPATSETARTASQKSAAPEPIATPSDTSSLSPSATTIDLKIKVNQSSWVSVKADGKTLVSTTLQPGVERSFKATDKIEMVLGNAGGVEISFNGKPVENASNAGEVRKITFTPAGYH
jgi:cytoskeleton protein RodZ